nr:growth-blocking peptide [Spodoptera exigua]
MKLTIAILFCAVLNLPYSANGIPKNLLENYRQKVQDTINNINQDVKSFFHPNENKKVQQNNDAASSIFFVEDESEEDFAAAAAARRPATVEVTTASTTSTTTSTVKPVETTTNNGTDRGRENFAGGCTPGYQRTADGRCKPTFG